MLFLSHRFMVIEQQKESSMLIEKDYENGERKQSIEKTVKNKNLNGSKRMRIKAAGRKPFIEKLDESVLE